MRILASCLLALACSAAAAAPGDETRAAFAAALARAESGAPAGPADEALRGYVLYPYLEAARLRAQLARGTQVDEAAQDWLASNPGLPITREVRREWLASLAARQDWARFLAAFEPALEDAALECHRFQAWIETGGYPELRDELLAMWMTGAQMPQSCVAPFGWLRAQGLLTAERNAQRARLALLAGNAELAEWLIRQSPPPMQPLMQRSLRLLKDPRAELAAIARAPASPIEWPEVLAALQKVARADPTAADALWARLGCANPAVRSCARIGADNAAIAERELALAYAWNRDPIAYERFLRLPSKALDERAHEWRIRSALWQGQYAQAAAWLHELPEPMAADARWVYWRARATELSGRPAQAAPIFRTLAPGNGYYALLSAWRLGEKHRPVSRPAPYEPQVQLELSALPAVQRARELFLIGRNEWANPEWRRALDGRDELARIQAARLASSWGWHVQAMATLGNPPLAEDFELSHPDAFSAEIAAGAQASGLPQEWLYGLIRQESLFQPKVISRSQAIGLMQLLLPTAREVARKEKRPAPSREDLFRPSLNIALGSAYLRQMLERFGGQFVPALSAYNGGPNAVARWLPDEPQPADVWMENIPFNETRLYVPKILWHMDARAARLGLDGFDPAPLLQPVRKTVP